jgi:hypothetical protein
MILDRGNSLSSLTYHCHSQKQKTITTHFPKRMRLDTTDWVIILYNAAGISTITNMEQQKDKELVEEICTPTFHCFYPVVEVLWRYQHIIVLLQ